MSSHCQTPSRTGSVASRMRKTAGMAVLLGVACWTVTAQSAQRAPKESPPAEATEEVREAGAAFQRVMSTPEGSIPPSVLARATGVGVFANVVQAAFIAGGRGGDGLISARRNGAWSSPAFFKLGGASIGAQIGGRKTDIVLVFTSKEALDALLDDRLEFGAEVKAVAGPNAAQAASAATTTDAGILVYTRDRGLFAGAALDGTVITPDKDLNRATYGHTARELLTGAGPSTPPAIVQPFLDMLSRHVPARS